MGAKKGEWITRQRVPKVEGKIDPTDDRYSIVKSVLIEIANDTAECIDEGQEEEDPIIYMGIWGDDTSETNSNKIKRQYRSVAKYLEGLGNDFPGSLSLRNYMTVMQYLYAEYRSLRFHEDRTSGMYEGEEGKRRLRIKYPDVKGPSSLFDGCNKFGLSIEEMKRWTLILANQVRRENAIYRIFD